MNSSAQVERLFRSAHQMSRIQTIRIILVFDSYSRDRAPLVRTQKEIIKHGWICKIISAANIVEYSILFKPHLILFGNPDLHHGENMTLLSESSVICSLPTEQSICNKYLFQERIIGGHNKNNLNFEPANIDVVAKFFLWSSFQYDALIDVGIASQKLRVIGNPRLINCSTIKSDSSSLCIGVALESEVGFNISYSFWALDSLPMVYGSMLNYSLIDLSILHAQLMLVKLLLRHEYKVIIRPRTVDRQTDYSFLGSAVEIDLSDDISYINSKSDFIITGQSTIGAESYLYGSKVISVLGVIDKALIRESMKEYLTFQHPNQPKSLLGILEIIKNPNLYQTDCSFIEQIKYYLGDFDSVEKNLFDGLQTTMKLASPLDQTSNGTLLLRILSRRSKIFRLMFVNRHNIFGNFLAVIILLKRIVFRIYFKRMLY